MARTNFKAHGLIVGGLIVDDSAEHLTVEVRQEVGLARRVQLDVTEVNDAHTH